MRSLEIGNAMNSQDIVRPSYKFATPYDRSQRHKEDFDMPIFLAIFSDRTALRMCTSTTVVRIRTAAVRTTYTIDIEFWLGNMSLKCCECLAIVARLPYEFLRLPYEFIRRYYEFERQPCKVSQHLWAWSLYCLKLLIELAT